MHWNNFSGSPGVPPARVEEDDEHRHDDEEAQGPQEVVQEDVDLCAAAVIWSLLGWIVIHRDPGSAVIKFCCCVEPCAAFRGSHCVVGICLNLSKEVDEGINYLVAIRNKNQGRRSGGCCRCRCRRLVLAVAKTCTAKARSYDVSGKRD